jgi:hypothetical protein
VRQGAEPADEGAGARGHGGLSRIPRSGLPALAAWLLLVGVIVAIALAGDELMGGTRGGSLAPFGSRVAAPARLVLTQPTAGMTISSRTVMVSGILRDGTTTLLARIWIGGDAEGSAMIPVDRHLQVPRGNGNPHRRRVRHGGTRPNVQADGVSRRPGRGARRGREGRP